VPSSTPRRKPCRHRLRVERPSSEDRAQFVSNSNPRARQVQVPKYLEEVTPRLAYGQRVETAPSARPQLQQPGAFDYTAYLCRDIF
jgi:hypothetical protein